MKRLSDKTTRSLRSRLRKLYPDHNIDLLVERASTLVGRYSVGLDSSRRTSRWDHTDVLLITYADTVRRDNERPLVSLRSFLTERLKGAINAVHILPFSPWSSDDGFSVIDYREVEPCYGTWDDVDAIADEFKLMFDLVLNHCSAESSWFSDFVSGVYPARNYFHEIDPDSDLSEVVRPRPWPLLTKAHTRYGETHVWTTFSADQVDLNFANPDVLFEFLDILMLYVSHGAKLIRLDAIAFLWKKIGTSCLHLPETHTVVKLLHDILGEVAPEVILLTETNVPHEENISYFGKGDETHMVYQFSLPPLLLHGLLNGDASHISDWAQTLTGLPRGCTYLNFTASHDGIGVRPLEGILDDNELNSLVDGVRQRGGRVSMRAQSDGSERPYELNITYIDALSDPDDTAVGTERFLCSQAVALAMRGIPAVYFHSLVGTRNYQEGVEETGENRTINRRKWDSDALASELNDPSTPHATLFRRYSQILRRRSGHPAFHPDGAQFIYDCGSEIFTFSRTAPDLSETVLCLFNFTNAKQTAQIPTDANAFAEAEQFHDILSGKTLSNSERGITLQPYQARWLSVR